jgi:hypothetical protein
MHRLMIIPVCAVFLGNSLAARGQAPPPRRQAEPYVIRFPVDAAVIDARRDLGAKGDGKADDTEALQRGLDLSCGMDGPSRVFFLPNGIYRVTRTLVVKNAVGPWLYGETRDGVIIRLDDGIKDCNSVLRTHPNETGSTSADWFMRNLRNFTVDVGNNPETDGIRYFATNSGMLSRVRVTGQGKVGINAGFLGQSGPNLIQDVEIDGFETGILSQWIWGETLSRVTIRNCRKQGVYVNANAVGIEDLTVENTPLGLVVDYPNDWTWWGGVVALVNGRFSGGDPSGPAIRNRSILYARNVVASGFQRAIASETPSGSPEGLTITEYVSHETKSAFENPAPRSLGLPIQAEPAMAWETDPSRWLCVNDHGAIAGDNQDDSLAFQRAFDAAAAQGKTTVYLRGIKGPDPNWYDLRNPVRVHGSVRHVLGLGFGRVLASDTGRFIVDDRAAPVVKFQNIDSFGGPPATIENRSQNRTLVVESCGVRVLGNGQGPIFMTDCPSLVEMRKPGQSLWARQLNPEGESDLGLVQNEGANIWALGVKSEGRGIRFRTALGGRTEILGYFVYGPGIDAKDKRPIFEVEDAQLSVAALREIAFDVPTYNLKLREVRGREIKTIGSDQEGGWIGWSLLRAAASPTR